MKGVILAGGTGSRLFPLTKVTNKHLLPVYDRPMIYHPIQALVNAGIRDIMIVTGGENAGDFLRLLGNGSEFGLQHLNYAYQEKPGGIAQALALAEHFVGNEKFVVALGDNIIQKSIRAAAQAFEHQPEGAKILLAEVDNPRSYGIARIDGNAVVEIIEKPSDPPSNFAVIGIYFYTPEVFKIIKTLKPSGRGELEITDVNNEYLRRGTLSFEYLDGWWADCGESIPWLLRANNLVARDGANNAG
ncbi:MAG TPA: sugar phosphate nucleotidyltransferase [Candidatus Latescibacteria bacterium]|nr:sugar phosphate nucleotidyltransferase [Candidatus Latescibacterota bacterium]HQE60942.1 sugar phosphate nucleotidyltransferase [Candidatus Latescibacterota bacterium]HRS95352.1 sugar phosphate nucleotidyltransferase [Candidatus Latescibacterota bacterium]